MKDIRFYMIFNGVIIKQHYSYHFGYYDYSWPIEHIKISWKKAIIKYNSELK
jgi:hypothetical protein